MIRDTGHRYPASIGIVAAFVVVWAAMMLARYASETPPRPDMTKPAENHPEKYRGVQGPMDPTEPGSGPNGEPAEIP
jgi:hypothetical protein